MVSNLCGIHPFVAIIKQTKFVQLYFHETGYRTHVYAHM
jgi:hypothetical protein